MKIAHLSDTHLGYMGSGAQKRVSVSWLPDMPVRQQAADIIDNFIIAIDRIIELQPDLVIHSGDVFDNSRPTAYIIDIAMRQLRRLSDAGIPIVLIEGNHSYPRDRSHGSILKILNHIPLVSVVYDEVARLSQGKLLIHAVPHRAAIMGHGPAPEDIDHTAINILVAHGVADGDQFYQAKPSVADLDIQEVSSWFSYVALGHYHRFAQISGTRNSFYSGSLSMVTWRDFRPCHSFGFNIVDLSDGSAKVSRELLATRPMHPYGIDDAQGLSAAEVLNYLHHQTEAMPPDDAYCRVVIAELDPLVRRQLSTRSVEEIFQHAAGSSIILRTREHHWDAIQAGIIEGGTLDVRFNQLVDELELDPTIAVEVRRIGNELLERAMDRISAEDSREGTVEEAE